MEESKRGGYSGGVLLRAARTAHRKAEQEKLLRSIANSGDGFGDQKLQRAIRESAIPAIDQLKQEAEARRSRPLIAAPVVSAERLIFPSEADPHRNPNVQQGSNAPALVPKLLGTNISNSTKTKFPAFPKYRSQVKRHADISQASSKLEYPLPTLGNSVLRVRGSQLWLFLARLCVLMGKGLESRCSFSAGNA
jgi:hypothetical protein